MFDTMAPVKGEGDYGYGVPEELEPLLARRDAEEVLADRDRMIAESSTELTRIVPGSQWQPHRSEDSVHCGDFGSTNGQRYFSRHYTSDVPVHAALWNQASQAVIDIAARYGYTDVTSRTENATNDQATDMTIRDADGGRVAFGSMAAASFQVTTGCYLTAEEKRQAREAAPK
ncbi:LppA family lipoprotein [Mycolicibacterium sp. HK-90]|uniref:LppA family lipoprotein n=1 Tax=Mycolicibacterium sp. HK-90 TaxID=3056937 RepID=UPI002659D18A|nr:LppA family lipoprotein [Mycolicibacterium sp. HK-90]WKG02331.1 LppA family lipoprotein [Mycolicibacterium sp. HK-90]